MASIAARGRRRGGSAERNLLEAGVRTLWNSLDVCPASTRSCSRSCRMCASVCVCVCVRWGRGRVRLRWDRGGGRRCRIATLTFLFLSPLPSRSPRCPLPRVARCAHTHTHTHTLHTHTHTHSLVFLSLSKPRAPQRTETEPPVLRFWSPSLRLCRRGRSPAASAAARAPAAPGRALHGGDQGGQ